MAHINKLEGTASVQLVANFFAIHQVTEDRSQWSEFFLEGLSQQMLGITEIERQRIQDQSVFLFKCLLNDLNSDYGTSNSPGQSDTGEV